MEGKDDDDYDADVIVSQSLWLSPIYKKKKKEILNSCNKPFTIFFPFKYKKPKEKTQTKQIQTNL